MIITFDQVAVFMLVFGRFAGMLISAPFFSMKNILSMAKVVLVFWATVLVIFTVPLPQELPSNMGILILALMTEMFIGYIIGFVANIIITAIEFAGTIMDTQAGLSSAAVLDPSSGQNAALMEQLMKQLAILLLLLINGHHMILSAIFESFSVLPIGNPINFEKGAEYAMGLGGQLFLLGFQLAAPIILVVFIVDFSFGILNKVAEQINVFQLGFQVKPIVSILIFLGIAPGLYIILINVMEQIMSYIIKVMGFMAT